MTKITVIKSDQAIYEDGESIQGCDMSGIVDDIHALQWDGSRGQIEYTNENPRPNLNLNSESEIKPAFGVSLSTLRTRRASRKKQLDD